VGRTSNLSGLHDGHPPRERSLRGKPLRATPYAPCRAASERRLTPLPGTSTSLRPTARHCRGRRRPCTPSCASSFRRADPGPVDQIKAALKAHRDKRRPSDRATRTWRLRNRSRRRSREGTARCRWCAAKNALETRRRAGCGARSQHRNSRKWRSALIAGQQRLAPFRSCVASMVRTAGAPVGAHPARARPACCSRWGHSNRYRGLPGSSWATAWRGGVRWPWVSVKAHRQHSAVQKSGQLPPHQAFLSCSAVVTGAIPRMCPRRLRRQVRTPRVLSRTTSPAAAKSTIGWTRRGPRYFGRHFMRVLAML
jgi:hypothetical protein